MDSVGRTVCWLHVSDFHFEHETQFDREEVLGALVDCAREYREERGWLPDLVFATGDIANTGRASEYDPATEFFDALLGATKLTKERLFVVPGNHDVDRREGQDLIRTPPDRANSDRIFDSGGGKYAAKLRAFVDWRRSYFGEARLLEEPALVQIRGSRVGILPINTALFCQDNSDHARLWVGVSWLQRALRLLNSEDPHIRIGLMHHPVDWLHDGERTRVRRELSDGLDVLLRGHLHDTEADLTASTSGTLLHLAAGASYQASQYPRRALFCRADLAAETLELAPVRFDDSRGKWIRDAVLFPDNANFEGVFDIPKRVSLANGTASGRSHPEATVCGTHKRRWTVGSDGVSRVAVTLSDFRVRDEVILALPESPYCDCAGDESARTPTESPEVRRLTLRDGRHCFRMEPQTASYANFEWGYRISNAVALSQEDIFQYRRYEKESGSALPDSLEGFHARPHKVRFSCDELSIEMAFDGEGFEDFKAVVLSEGSRSGERQWTRLPEEEHRCRVRVESGIASLSVKHPRVGNRYALAYRPPAVARCYPRDCQNAVDDIRDACRNEQARAAAGPSSVFTKAFAAEFESVLGGESLAGGTVWTCLLWDSRRGQLLTSFGEFRVRSWNARFGYGKGVAGHVFRFGRGAGWSVRDSIGEPGLIYQPITDHQTEYSDAYDWIVCIPLLAGTEGPVVGVVSFAGADAAAAGSAEKLLLDYAHDPERHRRLESELTEAAMGAFWGAAAELSTLSEGVRSFASKVLSTAVPHRASVPPEASATVNDS